MTLPGEVRSLHAAAGSCGPRMEPSELAERDIKKIGPLYILRAKNAIFG